MTTLTRPIRFATPLLVLAAVLGGCQVTPPRVEEPVVLSDPAWQTELPADVTVAGSRSAAAAETLGGWWKRFGDGELDGLIDSTLANNTDVQSALASVRVAVLERANRRADFLPTVEASASARTLQGGDDDAGANGPSYGLDLGASWELDLWGLKEARLTAAGESLEALRQSLRDTRVSLVAETARAYVELRRAQLQLDVTRRNVDIQAQTLQFVEWQRQVGLSTELEVTQSRANLERTRSQIPDLVDAVNRSINRLQVLTGQDTSTLRDALLEPRPLPEVPPSIVIDVPADALRQRPDVRASEHLVRAQAARVAEAQADRFPSFALSGSLGETTRTFSDILDIGNFARTLAASLAYSVFDGGRLQRAVETQRIELERALLDYEATVRAALEEAENALSALGNAQEQQRALTAAEEAAALAAELAALQYESGLVDFQTVLDTQETLLDTQSSLAVNRGNLLINVIQLYRALGGGWQAAEAEAQQPPTTEDPDDQE